MEPASLYQMTGEYILKETRLKKTNFKGETVIKLSFGPLPWVMYPVHFEIYVHKINN